MNGNFLKVGLIVKPQGILGEVKVNPLTDDINRFGSLKEAYIDDRKIKIARYKNAGNFVILKIEGVDDRNTAELLRNKFILVDRANAVPLKEGSYFIADLIGSKVYTENAYIGIITEVTNAKTDYLTVKTVDNKIMRFPFLKDVVTSFSEKEKVLKVKEKRLSEICVYED